MDTLLAARWQMTISLAFHMVFAAIGIGLPLLLVLIERQYLLTKQEHYKALARKWAKVTGLLFAVGAVSGTALSLELGLLWPKYMEITGAAVGHIFGLEGYAFFIEAIFIGLYLYAWDRISPRAHWWCGVAIAVSGAISGVFIMGVNAWMQVPVGFTMEAGRVVVSDPIAIFKQPAWVYMAVHSTLSCYMAVGFAVAGVYAWGWLKGRRDAYHRSAILTAMAIGGICAILQPLSGDLLSKFVFRTQPAKFAAMEGQFKTERYAPLRIGGWPDVEREVTKFAINVPGGLSFLATSDFSAEVPGLDRIPREDWPNVGITHAAFQTMVGLGMAMVALTIWFWIAWWRKKDDFISKRLGWSMVFAAPFGFLALEAGWMVTEVGRQPWVINGILRTADAVTPRGEVPTVFYSFAVLYIILAIAVIFLLAQLARPDREVLAPQSVKSDHH